MLTDIITPQAACFADGVQTVLRGHENRSRRVMLLQGNLVQNARSESRRQAIYDELLKYAPILETNLPAPLHWIDNHKLDVGKPVMRAYCERTDLNFHNRATWPEMYEFMFSTMLPLQDNFSDILPVLEEKFKYV